MKGLGFLFKPSTLSEYRQLIQSYSGDLFFNSGLLRLIVKKIVKVYSEAISYYNRCDDRVLFKIISLIIKSNYTVSSYSTSSCDF